MRLLVIALALGFIACGPKVLQQKDGYAEKIEKLRSAGKLTTKTSTNKTFVGSVTAYYDNGSLVLINSLADAEAAGTETFYYIKDGDLKNVLIIAATFDSADEWAEYYSSHKSVDRCHSCHGKPNCIVTEMIIGDKSTVKVAGSKEVRQPTQDEKTKMLASAQKTTKELQVLLKEL